MKNLFTFVVGVFLFILAVSEGQAHLLYQKNFDDGNIDDWTHIISFDGTKLGTWSVVDEALQISIPLGGDAQNIQLNSLILPESFIVEFDTRTVFDGGSVNLVAAYTHWFNWNNWIGYHYRPGRFLINGSQIENIPISPAASGANPYEWHHIKIIQDDSLCSLYFDDEVIFSDVSYVQRNGGYLVLAGGRSGIQQFDNLLISTPESVPEPSALRLTLENHPPASFPTVSTIIQIDDKEDQLEISRQAALFALSPDGWNLVNMGVNSFLQYREPPLWTGHLYFVDVKVDLADFSETRNLFGYDLTETQSQNGPGYSLIFHTDEWVSRLSHNIGETPNNYGVISGGMEGDVWHQCPVPGWGRFSIVPATLSDGLVAYYPFEGNTNDMSSNSNDGTAYGGGLTYKPGRIGQAALFDGVNDYIEVLDDPTLDIGAGENVTIQTWIKTTVGLGAMISKDDSSLPGGSSLVVVADGRPYFDGRDRNGYKIVWGENINLLDGIWHQVIGMRKGTIWSLWIDGNMVNSFDAGNTTAMDNDFSLLIGNSINFTYWFNGLMDDVRIYNRALSKDEIKELYYQPVANAIRSHDDHYSAGEDFEVCLNIVHGGSLTALGFEETIPEDWTFVSVAGDDPPPVYPGDDATGMLGFAWITPPESPIDFCYTLQVPESETGDKSFSGELIYRIDVGAEQRTTIDPDPDTISQCTYHSGDYNPSGWSLNLSELLRIIQFYNIGDHHCDLAGEDGYNPYEGEQGCQLHDCDYNPVDWSVDFSELLRAIQLYNVGSYHCDPDGEDGYAVGEPSSSSMMAISSEETLSASHSAGENLPRTDLIVSTKIEYEGDLTAVGVEVDLPTGWSFVDAGGDDKPVTSHQPGAVGTLEFYWVVIPNNPIEFTYTVHIPEDTVGIQSLTPIVKYRRLGGEIIIPVVPDPLLLGGCKGDFNGDGDVDGADLAYLSSNQLETWAEDLAGEFGKTDCPALPKIEEFSNSGCLPGSGITLSEDQYPFCGGDEMEVLVEGNNIQVIHRNATYNCCPDDIEVSLTSEGEVLKTKEKEILRFPCDCLCCYDVESIVNAPVVGTYTLEYSWYDYETERSETDTEIIQIE